MSFNDSDLILGNTPKPSRSLVHREVIFKVYLTRGVIAFPLALITTFSNGLVMFLFVKDPKRSIRSSPSCVLVASLALVDFLVGCGLEPTDAYYSLSIAYGKTPSIPRKVMQIASVYLLLCSVLLLMLITIDRYLAISCPIRYAQRINKKIVYASVVLVIGYCCALLFFVVEWAEDYRNEIFSGHIDLVVLVTITLFGGLVYSLRKQTRQLIKLSVNSDENFIIQASRRERKVTLTLAIMLVVFLACTMPWFLMMQMFDYCSICRKNWWIMKLLFISFQANCALNPFFCTLRLPRYKAALKVILAHLTFNWWFWPGTWRILSASRMKRKRSSGSYALNDSTQQKNLSPIFENGFPVLTQYQFKY